jgi:hypothetical protein
MFPDSSSLCPERESLARVPALSVECVDCPLEEGIDGPDEALRRPREFFELKIAACLIVLAGLPSTSFPLTQAPAFRSRDVEY